MPTKKAAAQSAAEAKQAATQAHPEFRSRPMRPHPLFVGLIDACLRAK